MMATLATTPSTAAAPPDQGPSRTHGLAEPAEYWRANRRATHQHHDVEGHDAAPQPRIDTELDRGVGRSQVSSVTKPMTGRVAAYAR